MTPPGVTVKKCGATIPGKEKTQKYEAVTGMVSKAIISK